MRPAKPWVILEAPITEGEFNWWVGVEELMEKVAYYFMMRGVELDHGP